MQTGITVKAGVAFLAGVLVALGGAVIYFKASDARPKPAAVVAAVSSAHCGTVAYSCGCCCAPARHNTATRPGSG